MAAEKGFIPLIDLLISHGLDVNSQSSVRFLHVFICAASEAPIYFISLGALRWRIR
jgi:hypothetical protein